MAVKGRSLVPIPAARMIASEIVVMEKNLAETRVFGMPEESAADILERVPDVLQVRRDSSLVMERSETSDRLEIPLHGHEIEDLHETIAFDLLA